MNTLRDDQIGLFESIEEIRRELVKLKSSPEFQRLQGYYEHKSLFDIIHVSRRERVHSSFISWLLNPQESHGLQEFPLRRLFEVISLILSDSNQSASKTGISQELLNRAVAGNYRFENITVEAEKTISKIGRFDIYIEGTITYGAQSRHLRIIIENKVKSGEHGTQTSKYYDWLVAARRPEDDNVEILLFLSPISNFDLLELTEPQCDCEKFVQINYQYLVDYLVEPCLRQDIPEQARMLIDDYVRTLSYPPLHDADRQEGELIMAIGNDERELLINFWNKHQRLLLTMLSALSSDPDQEPEVREKAGEAVNTLSSSGKDYSRFNIFVNGELEAKEIRKTDLAKEVIFALQRHDRLTDSSFSLLRSNKDSSFQLLKQEEEMTESEKEYRRYRMSEGDEIVYTGRTYYASGNWGKNNTPKFESFLATHFPEVRLERVSPD